MMKPEKEPGKSNNTSASMPVSPTNTVKGKAKRSLAHRASGAMFWNIIFLPLKAVLGLFVSVFLVKNFHLGAYASLAVVTSIQTTIGLYSDLGIERALPRFVAEVELTQGHNGLRQFIVLLTNIKLAILAALIVAFTVFADQVISLFRLGTLGRLYLALICAMLVLGALYDICTQILYSFFKQKVTNLLDVVVTVLNPLLTILFVWLQWNVLGVLLALFLTTVISVIIAAWQAIVAAREASQHHEFEPIRKSASKTSAVLVAAQPEPPGSPGASLPLLETTNEIELEKIQIQAAAVDRAFKTRSVRSTPIMPPAADGGSNLNLDTPKIERKSREGLRQRFTRYAALMYFFNVSAWFYDVTFAITVFTFFGGQPGVVAVALIKLIYGFIKQLLKTLLTPFNGVQTPLFSSIHAEGRDKALQTAYASLSKLQIFMLLPSGLGIIILARNLMYLLFQRSSHDAVLTSDLLSQAAWATILTVVFTFTEAIISLPMIVLMVYEKYKLVILARCIPFLTAPLLIVCALENGGVVTAVVIMGGLAVLSRVVTLIGVRQVLHLAFPVRFLWKVFKAGTAFAIPLGWLGYVLPANWPFTIAIAVVGGLIFFVVFKWLGGFDPEDKERLLNMKIPLRKYIIKYL